MARPRYPPPLLLQPTDPDARVYTGVRLGHTIEVLVNGAPLDPCLNHVRHSPDGFEWGYEGSGPAQLAFAILCDCLGADIAQRDYQRFKREWVTSFGDRWII